MAEIVTVIIGVALSALAALFVAARLAPFGAAVFVTYAAVLSLGSAATFVSVKRLPSRIVCVAGWVGLIALGLAV